MRNVYTWRWLPLLLVLLLPAAVKAQFIYTTNNGTLTITGYTGSGGEVTVPGTIDGLPVTSIGDEAFYYRTSLTNVTLPSSVTEIGVSAFFNCTNLASVTILGSGSNLSYPEFPGPPNQASVTNIGDSAFYRCHSLRSVTIPGSVTDIGSYAFRDCTSLASVALPGSLARMGNGAFFNCTSLASAVIPDGVGAIPNWAFSSCTSLTNVMLPASVTSLGASPFDNCPRLLAISVDAGNPSYSSRDGVLFNKSQTTLIQYPGGKSGPYTIPDGVTNIGVVAFDTCAGLTSLTVPASVTSIADWAFAFCPALTTVYFQGNAPTAGWSVFGDNSLATVYYLAGTTGWGATYAGRPTALWNPMAAWQPSLNIARSSIIVSNLKVGHDYQLLRSSNLTDWTSAEGFSAAETTCTLTNIWTPADGNMFFRVQLIR